MVEQLASNGVELPLSSRQDWCWELLRCFDEPYPKAITLDCTTSLRIRGRLDVGALREALGSIAMRHETLRYRLVDTGVPAAEVVRPRQVLRPDPFPLDIVKLTSGRAVPETVTEMVAQPFDLTDRLSRATLLRLAPDDHVLVVSIHHLVFDRSAHKIFNRELTDAYNRLTNPEYTSSVTDRTFDYADFIRQENTPEAHRRTETQLSQWVERLASHGCGSWLPGRTGAVIALEQQYEEINFEVPDAVTQGILKLSRVERASLFTVLLAALSHTVCRTFDRERIVVSTPYHGRDRPRTATALGIFANIANIPVDTRQATMRDLIHHVRAALTDATATVDLPFSQLAARILGRHGDGAFFGHALAHIELRLFGVTGWAKDGPDDHVPLDGLDVRTQEYTQDSSVIKLATPQAAWASANTLRVWITVDDRMHGFIRYVTDYFDKPVVEEIIANYQRLLTEIAGMRE